MRANHKDKIAEIRESLCDPGKLLQRLDVTAAGIISSASSGDVKTRIRCAHDLVEVQTATDALTRRQTSLGAQLRRAERDSKC